MINVNIDMTGWAAMLGIEAEVEKACKEAEAALAGMAQAHAIELAAQRLKTRRQMFVDALSLQEVDGAWLLQLDTRADWVDDGMPAHSMLEDLLASPKAKTARDGSKFLVIPFDHGPGQGPATATPAQLNLSETLQNEFKKRKIPWGKVERDDQGRPKLGKLHSFNLMDKPVKTREGPGQGKGPIGKVKQGPTGIPFLQGVTVYQHQDEKGSVRRSVMTFRVASSKHAGQGRWEHPGLAPANVMLDTLAWAEHQVDAFIKPALLEKLVEALG